jgi:hypothetical protein
MSATQSPKEMPLHVCRTPEETSPNIYCYYNIYTLYGCYCNIYVLYGCSGQKEMVAMQGNSLNSEGTFLNSRSSFRKHNYIM